MTKPSAYWVALSALALLASLTGATNAGAAPLRGAPPVPHVEVRPPTLTPLQQQSLWGINQNLQHDRDRWQRQQQKNTGTTKYLEY
jgi:hypothetical protein